MVMYGKVRRMYFSGTSVDQRDRLLAIGLQERVANHRKRLGSKAPVVSVPVAEKVPSGIRSRPTSDCSSQRRMKPEATTTLKRAEGASGGLPQAFSKKM